jgi:FKBP-type peptidyl-prolyl cis-trans isomerase
MQPYFYRFICLVLLMVSTTLSADEADKKDSIESRYVYTLGYRVGQSLLSQKIHSLNMGLFSQGVRDILHEKMSESSSDASTTETKPNTHKHYLMGYQIGQSLLGQGIKHVDIEILAEGINDSLQGNRPRMDELEMMDALSNYQNYQKDLRENNAQTKRELRMSN